MRIRIAVTSVLLIGGLVAARQDANGPLRKLTSSRPHRRVNWGRQSVATTAPASPETTTTLAIGTVPVTAVSIAPTVATTVPGTTATAATTPAATTTAPPPTTTTAKATTTTATSPATTRVSTPLPPLVRGVWQEVTPAGVSMDYNAASQGNFGMQTVVVAPSDPRVVYVGTCFQGVWKSTDAGASWVMVSKGVNGAKVGSGKNWSLAVDPTNADVVYATSGGGGEGLWKSTNGGVDWVQVYAESLWSSTSMDVYSVAIDPADHNHLLLGFHQYWGPQMDRDSGVAESKDGGVSWVVHSAAGPWGRGNYVFFVTSSRWLLASQDAGYWVTSNSGGSWKQVSSVPMTHGGSQLYRAKNGVLYVAALHELLRSTDGGLSWSSVPGRPGGDGYFAIVGDGTRMYVQTAPPWWDGSASYMVSDETDGLTWSAYNAQTFARGPMSMAFDPVNGILYSSNWNGGLWRLKV